MSTTTYDVLLRYRMQDQAGRGVEKLGRQAEAATKSFNGMSLGLGKIAAVAAGAFSVRAATQAFIGYNDQIDQAKITIAGLLQGFQGGTFNDQMRSATSLVDELQQKAKTSTSTTEELVGFLSDTISPLSAAGMKASEMAEFTAQAMVAAKALRAEGTAALDIQQALNSQVGIRDKFAKQILEMQGWEIDNFNKLNRAERLRVLQTALRADAIKEMAKAQENTFGGVFSTLKDNLQILLAKVGMPLFKAITAEIKKWNEWIERNQVTIENWVTEFGQTVKTGFEYAKSVVGWIVEHKDLLMALAKAWLVSKAVSGLGGPVIEAMGIFKSLKDGSITAAGKLDLFSTAVGAAVFALQSFIDHMEKRQEENIQKEVDFNSMRNLLYRAASGDAGAARSLLNSKSGTLAGMGLTDAEGNFKGKKDFGSGSFAAGALYDAIAKNMDFAGIDTTGDVMGEAARMQAALEKAMEVNRIAEEAIRRRDFYQVQIPAFAAAAKGLFEEHVLGKREDELNAGNKTNVKLTINRIEAKSDDPDRFVFALETALEDMARNPSQAADTLRRGL